MSDLTAGARQDGTAFTLETAHYLQESLPVFDFRKAAPDEPAVSSYLHHYSLDQLIASSVKHHSLGVIESGPFRIACQYFEAAHQLERGTVLVVHGYYDHVGLFRHAIDFCLTQGYSVMSFDLPGHGLSTGNPASIESFDCYSEALVDCLGIAFAQGVTGPWQVLAQSTGAAAVINCLLQESRFPLDGPDKIVLLAPLLQPTGWKSGLRKYWLVRWLVKQVKRDFAVNSHDEQFLRFIAEQDPLQAQFLPVDWVGSLKTYLRNFKLAVPCMVPVHIVQGTADTTVDWHYNLSALREKFPAASTHLIEGARHHLVNESAEYRNQLFTVLEEIFNTE